MSAHGSWSRERGTNLIDTGAPYYDVYETSDGRWMSIGALEPQFWAEAVRVLELEAVPDREDRERWPSSGRCSRRHSGGGPRPSGPHGSRTWTPASSPSSRSPTLRSTRTCATRHLRRARRVHPTGARPPLLPDTVHAVRPSSPDRQRDARHARPVGCGGGRLPRRGRGRRPDRHGRVRNALNHDDEDLGVDPGPRQPRSNSVASGVSRTTSA